MARKKTAKSVDTYIQDYLVKNPQRHAQYLTDTFSEKDPVGAFLSALRDVARARGKSMQNLSDACSLNRESLYRMLSPQGNPTIASLQVVLEDLGLQFSIQDISGKSPLRRA